MYWSSFGSLVWIEIIPVWNDFYPDLNWVGLVWIEFYPGWNKFNPEWNFNSMYYWKTHTAFNHKCFFIKTTFDWLDKQIWFLGIWGRDFALGHGLWLDNKKENNYLCWHELRCKEYVKLTRRIRRRAKPFLEMKE